MAWNLDGSTPTFDRVLFTFDGFTGADTLAPSWSGASGLSVGSIGSSTATATWNAATDNTAVTGYLLRLTPSGGSATVIDTGSTATSRGLSGLISSTSYLLEIAAYDAASNVSAYQAGTASFTTNSASSGGTFKMSQYTFGAGVLIGTPKSDAAGNAIANPSPVQFGALQDVSLDISFDTKMLYGSNQFPLAIGRGKGKISGKASFAQINGSLWNSLVFGQTLSAGILSDFYDTTGTAIPATPFQITPTVPSSGTWSTDLGVRNASGVPLTKVASAPATGQYSVSAGTYTFAAADTGTTVFISYQYTASSTSAQKSTVLNVLMGYAPTFQADLYIPYNGKSFIVSLPNCISTKLSIATKLDDFNIPSFDFEAFADASGNVLTYGMSDK